MFQLQFLASELYAPQSSVADASVAGASRSIAVMDDASPRRVIGTLAALQAVRPKNEAFVTSQHQLSFPPSKLLQAPTSDELSYHCMTSSKYSRTSAIVNLMIAWH